jgi:hypothetical protein
MALHMRRTCRFFPSVIVSSNQVYFSERGLPDAAGPVNSPPPISIPCFSGHMLGLSFRHFQ